MIQDILTVKIERNIYVNEEKSVSEIKILINKTFLLFSHHELLMSFIMKIAFVYFACELIVGFHSRDQQPCFSTKKKRKRLHNNRVEFPEDLVEAPTWPPFLCLGALTWRS